jgi:hypothetical protein
MAATADTRAVFAVLCTADPDVMDRDKIVDYIRSVASLKAWCESLNVRATRRQRQLAAVGRAEAPKDFVARPGHVRYVGYRRYPAIFAYPAVRGRSSAAAAS